jgi:hypothetical protein
MLGVLGRFRHRRFRRDLSAYLDDMLSERARRRLEAHLDSCEACRQELAELRVTIEALGSLPMAEAPRSFTLAAAPVAEARPRPAARRLEFGLRLATATAAFALALVMIGDFAGLPGGGDEEEEVRGGFLSAAQETPAAPEAAAAGTPEPYGITGTFSFSDVQRELATDETPPAPEATPVETPAAEQTPAPPEGTPVETPAAPLPGVTEPRGEEPAVSADVSEEEPSEKAALEGAEVEWEGEAGVAEAEMEDEVQADGAEAQAVADEDEGGLSREEAVHWLEIGLGAGVGVLVVIWAFARFQRNIGNRP